MTTDPEEPSAPRDVLDDPNPASAAGETVGHGEDGAVDTRADSADASAGPEPETGGSAEPPGVGDEQPERPPESDAPAEETSFLPPQDLRAILEALVFASPNPVTAREIDNVLGGIPRETWQAALEDLRADYAREGRGLQLVDVAGGMQITTRPEYNDWVRELLNPKAPTRLSIQALETLAVIAYKQPVTLPEVIELRGVKSGGVIKTLLERRLVRITGRKEVVGRPMLYGTTKEFLLHFGLKDLTELPKIEEFAEVLGEEVDVESLKKAIEAPPPTEVPLAEEAQLSLDAIAEPEVEAPPSEPGPSPDAPSVPSEHPSDQGEER